MFQAANAKARGVLFWRGTLSSGGNFRECYATVEKGKLDFYKKEQDFVDHENSINKKPFQLWEYAVETDYRKFGRNIVTPQAGIRGAVIGQSDFSMIEIMRSPYDLKEASKKFKFALIPKVYSHFDIFCIL